MTNTFIVNRALRILRHYCDYTQIELSNAIGVPQSIISEIESEKRQVSLETLQKYSIGLDIRMSQLLFFAEEIDGKKISGKRQMIVAEKVIQALERIKPRASKS